MTKSIKSTSPSSRIASLDFLRGVAVLSILFINIENFAYPDSWSPWKYGFEDPIDRDTRFWVYFLTQGKFYNMFALLFGVGFYIFLERLEKKDIGLRAMDIYARRLLWLFVIGITHAYFIWTGDVLYHYAICGFLLFPFRSISNKSLLLIIAFFCTLEITNTYNFTSRRISSYDKYIEASSIPKSEWTEEQQKRDRYWQHRLEPQQSVTSKVIAPKETYWEGLKETYKNASVHKGLIYNDGLLFPSLIIMIIGIMLYRSGIFHNYKVWKRYWLISLSILIAALLINYFRFYQWTYKYYEPVLNQWRAGLFNFTKITLGLGYILILNGLYQKFLQKNKINLISKIGRMALTNYIFQNTLLGLIFYGYGLAQFNQYSRFELLGIVLIIWIIQMIFSWLWLKGFNQGPLEWLWRRLTYQSFKDK